jgi:hypothetical protein
LQQALTDHADEWAAAIQSERESNERALTKAIERPRSLEEQCSALRSAAAGLRERQQPTGLGLKLVSLVGQLPIANPKHSDARLTTLDAIDALAEYARQSSVQGEREAAEARAEHEREAEERREQLRQGAPALIGAQ